MPKKQKRRNRQLKRATRPAVSGMVVVNKGALRKLIVRHREYVGSIVSAGGDDERRVYMINPGHPATFPWLSRIAQCFETYNFRSLGFSYYNSVGTDTDGIVSFHPDYDAEDDNTTLTLAQLYSFKDSIRMPVWDSHRMPCSSEGLNKRKRYYVAENSSGARSADVGTIIVSTSTSHVGKIGDLWVDYTVEFQTPQLKEELIDQGTAVTLNVKANDELLSDTTKSDGKASILANEAIFSVHNHSGKDSVLEIAEKGRYLVELIGKDNASGITGINAMSNHLGTVALDAIALNTSAYFNSSGLFDVVDLPGRINMGSVTAGGLVDSVTATISRVDPNIISSIWQ